MNPTISDFDAELIERLNWSPREFTHFPGEEPYLSADSSHAKELLDIWDVQHQVEASETRWESFFAQQNPSPPSLHGCGTSGSKIQNPPEDAAADEMDVDREPHVHFAEEVTVFGAEEHQEEIQDLRRVDEPVNETFQEDLSVHDELSEDDKTVDQTTQNSNDKESEAAEARPSVAFELIDRMEVDETGEDYEPDSDDNSEESDEESDEINADYTSDPDEDSGESDEMDLDYAPNSDDNNEESDADDDDDDDDNDDADQRPHSDEPGAVFERDAKGIWHKKYLVEKILDSRRDPDDSSLWFQVKWQGSSAPEYTTWEPYSHVQDCGALLADFHFLNRRKPHRKVHHPSFPEFERPEGWQPPSH